VIFNLLELWVINADYVSSVKIYEGFGTTKTLLLNQKILFIIILFFKFKPVGIGTPHKLFFKNFPKKKKQSTSLKKAPHRPHCENFTMTTMNSKLYSAPKFEFLLP
jgi:hypothetical protein